MSVHDTISSPARSDGGHVLRLSDREREVVAQLVDELVRTPPGLVDDAAWLEHARRLSCRLPDRLIGQLRAYRHDPGDAGTLLVVGLPVDLANLPLTPGNPGSVERVATRWSTVPMLIGLQLGEIVAYRNEKHGALLHNVVPIKGFEASQSNAGTTPLELHVENAFHPCRPDYVGLLCLREDHAASAGTLVASIRRALPMLDPTDVAVLCEPRFATAPPPSFGMGEQLVAHPILQGDPDDPDIVFDLHATHALDEVAQRSFDALRLALGAVTESIVLQAGQMAFVDNRIALHGRTQFASRHDGYDRWLHRVYVQLDNRRSRRFRESGTPVLA